eukprot:IDg9851t1
MGPRAAPKAVRPTYAIMVAEAIRGLADRTGSSVPAITKQLMALYSVDVNKTALSNALKKGVDSGDLVKIRASYKLGKKVPTKPKAPIKKKVVPAKAATKVSASAQSARSRRAAADAPRRRAPQKAAPKKSGPKKTITKKAAPKKATTKR